MHTKVYQLKQVSNFIQLPSNRPISYILVPGRIEIEILSVEWPPFLTGREYFQRGTQELQVLAALPKEKN